jgi:putative glutamine amidotransferase
VTAPRRVAVVRWEQVPGEQIEAYWRRLSQAGLEPVDLHEPGQSLDGVAGLVLTGGIDIDPSRYGETPHERVRQTDPARDAFEVDVLDQALRRDLPVLAICRGHQLLNVVFGGSLLQHIESWEHASLRDEARTSAQHLVILQPESRLHSVLAVDSLVVNSRHHQGVTTEGLAAGLRVAAVGHDGLIEAMESLQHRWVVGVQWHPEREEAQITGLEDASKRLFQDFASVCRI